MILKEDAKFYAIISLKIIRIETPSIVDAVYAQSDLKIPKRDFPNSLNFVLWFSNLFNKLLKI